MWLTLLLQTLLVAAMSALFRRRSATCRTGFGSRPARRAPGWRCRSLWVLLEWLRGWCSTGFPWLSLGYAMIDSPLAGWAPLLGVYGVTWAALSISAALNVAFMPLAPLARRGVALGAAALLFALPASLKSVPLDAPVRAAHSDRRRARRRAPGSEVAGEQSHPHHAALPRLTGEAWGARLIIWPEASLPVLATDIPDYLRQLEEQGRAHGADFAIGLVDYQAGNQAVFQWDPGAERAPATGGTTSSTWCRSANIFRCRPSCARWLRLMSLPYDDFTAGSPRQPLLSAAGRKAGLEHLLRGRLRQSTAQGVAGCHAAGQRHQ